MEARRTPKFISLVFLRVAVPPWWIQNFPATGFAGSE
jgi:hypothetical protein